MSPVSGSLLLSFAVSVSRLSPLPELCAAAHRVDAGSRELHIEGRCLPSRPVLFASPRMRNLSVERAGSLDAHLRPN